MATELLASVRDEWKQALVDSISDLAWMKDTDSRFVAVNQSLATLVGRTPEQMLGKSDHDYFPSDLADEYVRGDREVLSGREVFRTVERIPDASGGTRWIETIKTPVRDETGAVVGVAGVARDITERLELEVERLRLVDELAGERDRLNDMIANVPGVVWEEMFDGSYRFVSDQVETLLGYTVDEYLDTVRGFLDLVPEEDRPAVEKTNAEIVANGRGGTHFFRLRRKNGTSVWCESHCRVIVDATGKPIGIRGVSYDISARKSDEDRLRASEEHFRKLADSTPVMIWSTDATGETEFLNRQTRDFLGVAENLAGHRWNAFVHPGDEERVRGILVNALKKGVGMSFEMRYRRHDGVYRDLYVEGVPRKAIDGSSEGMIGTCVDLTDRRRLERRVEQERQLGSLGRLAATIAHEINNVLMAIQPLADVIRSAPPQDVLTRAADSITSSVHRGGRITHQILRYAKTSEPQREAFEVAAWLAKVAPELEAILGPAIALRLDVPSGICMLADRDQLMQVLVNLASNARDALTAAGTVTIAASVEETWPDLADESGPFVHLVVSDDGPGIDSAVLDRLFEPLFTTKPAGTGLGLAIVHDIVRRHRGHIYAARSAEDGAAFHLIIPAAVRAVIVPEREAGSLPQNVQRIVLVEDDDMVAQGLVAILEMEGAEVTVVGCGAEALDAVNRVRPDLMVLDIGLPDMPGTEVFEQVRSYWPHLPVLFSTGHAGEIEDHVEGINGHTAHLLKPYDSAALIRTIRKLMERSTPADHLRYDA